MNSTAIYVQHEDLKEENGVKQLLVSQSTKGRLNQEDCMIAFSDLSYWIGPHDAKSKRESDRVKVILSQLNGYIPVGKLTAVIGQSGSGKTTFLEVLSGVPTSGWSTGNISRFVGGEDIEFALINQIPTLSANETVEEVIKFGCNVFNDKGRSKEEIEQKVNKILFDFNLIKVRNSMISTLSGGEKKRVSVARHLAGDPKVMVLDEPTSGLDTFNAFNMIRILKNLCLNDKCTIILSIHQPQKRIVDLFDYLISFKNGRIVFQGETQEAIDSRCELLKTMDLKAMSTEDRRFVEDQIAKSASPMTNATEYQLETEYLFSPKQLSEWNETFIDDNAPMMRSDTRRISTSVFVPVGGTKTSKALQLWTARDVNQGMRAFQGLVGREMREYKRNKFKIPIILIIHILCALFLGLTYGKMGNQIDSIQNRFGALAFIGLFIGILSISFIGTLYEGRAVYIEERNGRMYGAIPYFAARVFPSVLFMRILPTVTAAIIFYQMVGFQSKGTLFTEFIVIAVLLSAVTTFSIVAISSISKTIYSAATAGILFNTLMVLFGGMFIQNSSDLTWAFRWIKYLSFYEQAMEVVMVNEFTGLKFEVGLEKEISLGGVPQDLSMFDVEITGEFFLGVFGMDPDEVDFDYAMLIVFGLLYLAISLAGLQFLHRTTR